MAGTGESIVTCAFETDCGGGDGDWLAHNPEVMARAARWAGQGGAHCCWSRYIVLGVLSTRSPCGRPSQFSSNVALVLADSCCLADDLAMACQAATVGANVDPLSAGRRRLR